MAVESGRAPSGVLPARSLSYEPRLSPLYEVTRGTGYVLERRSLLHDPAGKVAALVVIGFFEMGSTRAGVAG